MQTVAKDCKHKDCHYRRKLNRDGSIIYCAYCAMTGTSRNCLISECDKYVKKHKRKPRMTRGSDIEWDDEDE